MPANACVSRAETRRRTVSSRGYAFSSGRSSSALPCDEAERRRARGARRPPTPKTPQREQRSVSRHALAPRRLRAADRRVRAVDDRRWRGSVEDSLEPPDRRARLRASRGRRSRRPQRARRARATARLGAGAARAASPRRGRARTAPQRPRAPVGGARARRRADRRERAYAPSRGEARRVTAARGDVLGPRRRDARAPRERRPRPRRAAPRAPAGARAGVRARARRPPSRRPVSTKSRPASAARQRASLSSARLPRGLAPTAVLGTRPCRGDEVDAVPPDAVRDVHVLDAPPASRAASPGRRRGSSSMSSDPRSIRRARSSIRRRGRGSRSRSAAGSGRAALPAGDTCPRTRSGSGWRGRGTARSSARVTPSVVTWRSCMASSSAACVFGGARLISSARSRLAKIGPGRNSKSASRWFQIDEPVTSAGIRSGVNWTRAKRSSVTCANERAVERLGEARVVLEQDVAVARAARAGRARAPLACRRPPARSRRGSGRRARAARAELHQSRSERRTTRRARRARAPARGGRRGGVRSARTRSQVVSPSAGAPGPNRESRSSEDPAAEREQRHCDLAEPRVERGSGGRTFGHSRARTRARAASGEASVAMWDRTPARRPAPG